MSGPGHGRRIDFERVNAAACRNGEMVAAAFLPDGHREGREWVARNPRRDDRRPGSLKCNTVTGKGADFATGVRWGDFTGLVAFVCDLSQRDAAIRLAEALGVDPYE